MPPETKDKAKVRKESSPPVEGAALKPPSVTPVPDAPVPVARKVTAQPKAAAKPVPAPLAKPKKGQSQRPTPLHLDQVFASVSHAAEDHLGCEADPAVRRWLHSGSTLLDHAIGGRGYPGGKVTEIVGHPASGKTLLAMVAGAVCQRQEGLVFWEDPECGFSVSQASNLARLDLKHNFIYHRPMTAERTLDSIVAVLPKMEAAGRPCLVVIDSLAALCPRARLEQSFDETPAVAQMGRMTSQFFARAIRDLGAADNVFFILINQHRSNIRTGWQPPGAKSPEHGYPGGKSTEFYAAVRLELNRFEINDAGRFMPEGPEKGRPPYGAVISVQVAKNKVGPPFRRVALPIYFRPDQPRLGLDDGVSCLVYLMGQKEIRPEKPGSQQYLFGERRGTRRAFMKLVCTDEEFRRDVISAASETYLYSVCAKSDPDDESDGSEGEDES